jgi:pimeloyl-ACP methyl ester carboxylesterase
VDQQAVTVDGQELSYRCSTGAGRTVIFVHGNSSSARTWRALVDSGKLKALVAIAPAGSW